MMQCPHCGNSHLEVERLITVPQTLTIHCHPNGNYEVEEDELGDTISEGEFTNVHCLACDSDCAPQEAMVAFAKAHVNP